MPSQDLLSCIVEPGSRDINRTVYTYPEYIESENFKIHFTTSDVDLQFVNGQWFNLQSSVSYAQSIINHAESSLAKFLSQGWERPPPDCDETITNTESPSHCTNFGGNSLYDIYIANDGVGMVIPETPYEVEPYTGGYTSYMKISTLLNEYSTLPSWSYHVVAHELHHSIQLRYGYSVSGSPGQYIYNGWFFEQTATYMENVVYPNSIHLRTMLANCNVITPLTNPALSIDYPSDVYPYRSALWQKFLVESLGDSSIVRLMWEEYGQNYASGFPTSLFPIYDNTISIVSNGQKSLSDAYMNYAIWRYFTGDRSTVNQYFYDGSAYCTSPVESFYDEHFILKTNKGSARYISLPSDDIDLVVTTDNPADLQLTLLETNNDGDLLVTYIDPEDNSFPMTINAANTNLLVGTVNFTSQASNDIEFYVEELEIPLIGDINFDGYLDILDVVLLIDYIVYPISYLYQADLNDDGVVNVLDVVSLVNNILS